MPLLTAVSRGPVRVPGPTLRGPPSAGRSQRAGRKPVRRHPVTDPTRIRGCAVGAELRNDRAACSDEQLVALLRRGRQDVFDTLAERYERRLLWLCQRMLRSHEDAQDAVQDVLLSAFNAIFADERAIDVGPWLYRIARNRCINQLRRATTIAFVSIDDLPAEHGRTPIDSQVGRQRFRELIGDMGTLADTQRTALVLREIDGLAYQQIAHAMDTTVPGVRSLLVRARGGLLKAAALRDATLDSHPHPAARSTPTAVTYQAVRATAALAA